MTLQDEKKALDALEFAQGAILDAIGLEDGLDGAAGAAVIRLIRDALEANGRVLMPLPDDTTEALYESTAERLYAAVAARDHLRARLQDLATLWEGHADGVERLAKNDSGFDEIDWEEEVAAYRTCAADLLAVLTEPTQEDIRGNGPINAVGPALDTEGDTP